MSRLIKLFIIILTVSACEPDLRDADIPPAVFDDVIIRLNLPQYTSLNTKGYYEFGAAGLRGIIIYKKDASHYLAYETNCSFQPNEACATVNVHTQGLYMFDPCCGSSFDFANGKPIGGPAWRPLRQYKTYLSGGELIITDEALN